VFSNSLEQGSVGSIAVERPPCIDKQGRWVRNPSFGQSTFFCFFSFNVTLKLLRVAYRAVNNLGTRTAQRLKLMRVTYRAVNNLGTRTAQRQQEQSENGIHRNRMLSTRPPLLLK
jgi:hypothetical protein